MQYKVPQNVDIEDKVIGPLTLRQFMIILIGVGIDLFLYFTLAGFVYFLFLLLAMLVSAAALFLAFGKMNEQKLEIFVMSAYQTLLRPRKRIWKKEPTIIKEKTVQKVETKGFAPKNTETKNADDFQRLAELVDSGGLNNIAPKDRAVMAEPKKLAESAVTKDIIKESESESTLIDPLLDSVKAPQKAEPTVSQMASVSPDQKFDYPKIKKFDN